MIKAVLIDDERPALRAMEYLLKDNKLIEISAVFTDPIEAIIKIKEIMPQIVFLDINMPQLQGIDVASKILDICPRTDIVFVTAYSKYAVEAFELCALDYILKPIVKERLEKTLIRLNEKHPICHSSENQRLIIKCFGKFQIGWANAEPIKWRSEKTKELFAFLLQNREREVTKDEIIESLWTHCELQKAVHQLHNGIYYIRKTLEAYGVEESQMLLNGSYCLRLRNVEFDVMLFQQSLSTINNMTSLETLEVAVALYEGDYLDKADWLWVIPEREKLKMSYNQMIQKLVEILIEQKKMDRAEEYLIRSFNQNPYEEATTNNLLKLYEITNNKTKAEGLIKKYSRMLKKEIGIKNQK